MDVYKAFNRGLVKRSTIPNAAGFSKAKKRRKKTGTNKCTKRCWCNSLHVEAFLDVPSLAIHFQLHAVVTRGVDEHARARIRG